MPPELLEIYIPFLIGYEGTLTEFKRKPVNNFKLGDTKRLGISWQLYCQLGEVHKKSLVYESFITLKIKDVIAIANFLWKQIDKQEQCANGLGIALLDWMFDNAQINDEPRFVYKKCREGIAIDLDNNKLTLQKYMAARREIMKKYIDAADKRYTSEDIAKVTQLENLIIHNNLL